MSVSNANFTGSPGIFTRNYTCEQVYVYMLKFNDPLYKTPVFRRSIITAYIIVAIVGALGNLLVFLAVLKNPAIRTPRNMFIINLSATDFTMSLVTVPFTFKYVLFHIWELGDFMCRTVSMMQAVNIFVSTMSITAIGLDRYWVILFPTKTRYQNICLAISFLGVWLISVVMALPMFFNTHLQSLDDFLSPKIQSSAVRCGYANLVGCFESDTELGKDLRKAYCIGCFLFQYALPILTLAFVYNRIMQRLRRRFASLNPSEPHLHRVGSRRRQARVNLLLISVVVTFAVCWLPLNTFIILQTFDIVKPSVPIFAFCHIAGVLSACVNPVLYGILNENFRREFVAILTQLGGAKLCVKLKSLCDCRSRQYAATDTNSPEPQFSRNNTYAGLTITNENSPRPITPSSTETNNVCSGDSLRPKSPCVWNKADTNGSSPLIAEQQSEAKFEAFETRV